MAIGGYLPKRHCASNACRGDNSDPGIGDIMTSVALAHDVLAARAGGERLFLAMTNAFPEAPVRTLFHDPAATFAAFSDGQITSSWLDRSTWLRQNYRHSLPLAALTFAGTRIDADVTICSTSGLSHHVRTRGAKIVYCHTPARWLHDTSSYMRGYSTPVRMAATAARPPFRQLDRLAMRSASRVIANSSTVAHEIGEVYGIDASVIPPCSTFELDGPVEPLPGVEPGFVLSPTRPLGYKRLDVLVQAARTLPSTRFVHVGDGPHRQAVFADAPDTMTSFGAVSDAQLRWAYRNARVVALTCAEDFGLVPLEAAAHGVHTVAPHARGLLDHDTSLLSTYPFASAAELAQAIMTAAPPTGERQPERLGVERFTTSLMNVVDEFR